ncbi:MAG: winged helix-turn-helix transcriptional regulator [Nanoarchaeota archaeon]|nr:winged helix-turn-helix transcriptional regulator [Nanoarchaeota archaeon]
MGLLARLKKLLKSSEEKKEERQEPQVIVEEPQKPVIEEPKVSFESTEQAIKSWEKTLEAAKQHPLSQVKIINTQILEELSNVLKSMDSKLNKLDKLDEILEILIETKKELEEKGVESKALSRAIEEIERLTIKDKEVVAWIEKQGRVTAKQLADYTGLSRSTASFRLNRLAEIGVLEKQAIGKKIYYKPKNI